LYLKQVVSKDASASLEPRQETVGRAIEVIHIYRPIL
jgi:hypothetical protein